MSGFAILLNTWSGTARWSDCLRYSYDDGLPGMEGGFNLCTTWLIEAYACQAGTRMQNCSAATKLAGSTLLSEEYDPAAAIARELSAGLFASGADNAALVLDRA